MGLAILSMLSYDSGEFANSLITVIEANNVGK